MNKTLVEYVWIGGNYELRSKTRVFNNTIETINDLPDWNFDGSSTGQSFGSNTEIIIKPCCLFNDPFRKHKHKLVMCDTYDINDKPLNTNHRFEANNIFNEYSYEKPWFGLEQEYFIMDTSNNIFKLFTSKPLGYSTALKQGQYYCSVGSDNAFGRNIAEEHLKLCLDAGINISGINSEVAPGQWEFQIGPCVGIEQGDHLWMARYILCKLSEKYNVSINFEPKPLKGDWNGSGCHTNVSTKKMREGTEDKTGLDYIYEAIDKLKNNHLEHMKVYGSGNEERMTGKHETASYNEFTYSVGGRNTSIRIGNETYKNKCGYFEDRRPSSNCDPYLVTSTIMKTIIS